MIDEARALGLLHEVNPVRDMESYDVSEADIAGRLATLIERSAAMTQLNTRNTTTRRLKPRLTLKLAGGFAAILIVVAALAILTRPDSNETAGNSGLVSSDFVGTWTPTGPEGLFALFVYFDEHGRYALSDSFGAFEERILETGSWTFDGQEFVFTTDESTIGCAGTVGRYRPHRVDDDRIQMTVVRDNCNHRHTGAMEGPMRKYPLDPEFTED